MALRIRANGNVVCAAQYEEKEGDIYIDDSVHYILARYFEQDNSDDEWAEVFKKSLDGDDEAIKNWRASHPENKLVT